MTTGRINQGTVTAVRFLPRAAWAPGFLFVPLSFVLPFFHILGRVGRPTLDRHQGCSVTRGRAYSLEWCAWLARARTRGESIAKYNLSESRMGPRPRAEGRSVAMKRSDHFAGWRTTRSFLSLATRPPTGEMGPSKQSPRAARAREAKGGRREGSPSICLNRGLRAGRGAFCQFSGESEILSAWEA